MEAELRIPVLVRVRVHHDWAESVRVCDWFFVLLTNLVRIIYAALFYFVLEASRMLRPRNSGPTSDDGFVPLIEQENERKEVPPQYAI